jgi:heme exporter protein CcmD
LGYVIAAYGIVIGSLAAYALWINSQRRRLMARGEQAENDSGRI